MPRCVVLQHYEYEGLGMFESVVRSLGYDIEMIDSTDPPGERPAISAAEDADVVFTMGGYMGVYETEKHPWILEEMEVLRRRIAADRPTLGICLGAQLMAAALGARVYPSGKPEIGWFPVQLERDAPGCLAPLAEPTVAFHWHMDTFDLPPGARHVLSTSRVAHQGFAHGRRALGLQFHPEVNHERMDDWIRWGAEDLEAGAGEPGVMPPDALHAGSAAHGPGLREAGAEFLRRWIAGF